MRKTRVLSLLTLILYNLVGYLATFRYLRYEWRQEVRQHLAELSGDVETKIFQFSAADFDPSVSEFPIDGHFYDVIRYEKSVAGDWTVYCFDDRTEARLYADFRDQIMAQNNTNTDFRHKAKQLFKNLLKEFQFEPTFLLDSTPSVFRTKTPVFPSLNTFLKPVFLDADTLPPEFFLI